MNIFLDLAEAIAVGFGLSGSGIMDSNPTAIDSDTVSTLNRSSVSVRSG